MGGAVNHTRWVREGGDAVYFLQINKDTVFLVPELGNVDKTLRLRGRFSNGRLRLMLDSYGFQQIQNF